MEKLFVNKMVVISGGMGDIGRAMAIEFAKHGSNIALCDLKPDHAATEFLDSLKQYNVSCTYAQVDVTDAASVKEWIDAVELKQGIPEIIIANAATVTLASLYEITPEEWNRELRVNLDGAFHITQIGTAKLLQHKLPGRVVFIGSWAGYTPHPHIPAYCVSKAAMRMLCKCMALELAPHNILVNELALGYVAAGLSGNIWKQDLELEEKARSRVPVQKVMSAEQVALQVIQLCHPGNEHMTGSTILMDGGLSLLS
ncbi:SDR family NAD(P)-dependent oxidoreductase [Flavisolibacter ginsenosidimutans]|uniref:SDR family oxidoreductase n=1 Tax=Flavisolibacter ginsenosidimutans TaxID=661481 RepID=A0A5B8UQY3_9BACT|nr:SDR family oxidoreductase [Flavisolibacter ginsenosidimutans]QEC54355.1 SDR family oxidoreductase [Flavisolibacter ginsenosidimutans]QEC58390.1 SDR family oxidoreductase [Flavisolibacter ginsenosidimutans]